ncbi:MAG: molybdopterin synthase sulfur carrier subunit [Thaumarchaeota archaeon]|nr:MAG: molybdopterin synthase sulfur carrier subunit [Nitrososphaerota archaeon]
MTKVKVLVFVSLRDKVGWSQKEVMVDGDKIRDLLKSIKSVDGRSLYEIVTENGKLRPNFLILLNGREISFLNGLNTKIKDGDTISIFPPAGGG